MVWNHRLFHSCSTTNKYFLNDKDVKITSDDGSGGTANYILADGSTGEVKLYHYGTEKFKTISTGNFLRFFNSNKKLYRGQ